MHKPLVVLSDDTDLVRFCSRVLRPQFSQISINNMPPDPVLILLDFAKISSDGFVVLENLVRKYLFVPVIIISRDQYSQFAVQCIKSGAADFIEFPCKDETLLRKVRLCCPLPQGSRAENGHEVDMPGKTDEFAQLIGVSPAMCKIKQQLVRIACSDLPVLLLGESGTGKTVIAKLIHEHSARRTQPYCEINMGGLNEQLADSELFGTVPGAYTGAVNRSGLIEKAHRGSLFLDEIGDLALSVQTKLLHTVENGLFRRLGTSEEKHSDVRIISATNVNIAAAMRQKTFREDLYYRLAVLQINIPPLRERPEDIAQLAVQFAASQGKKLSPTSIKTLCTFDWPGNVRQLYNSLLRACFMTNSDTIENFQSDFF